jgi:hypothetical protein
MTTPEWRRRVLALARKRHDRAAVAIVEGGRTYAPAPPPYVLFVASLRRVA